MAVPDSIPIHSCMDLEIQMGSSLAVPKLLKTDTWWLKLWPWKGQSKKKFQKPLQGNIVLSLLLFLLLLFSYCASQYSCPVSLSLQIWGFFLWGSLMFLYVICLVHIHTLDNYQLIRIRAIVRNKYMHRSSDIDTAPLRSHRWSNTAGNNIQELLALASLFVPCKSCIVPKQIWIFLLLHSWLWSPCALLK